ncbi:MAG: patatin-like phospholipase family protein [Candidatus Marinimicrobia bacterium]|nr:patatin-like phospholipase family protein [Candidatus Neomarinimicrobiota bacterium]
MKWALVLSGGGGNGIAHIGVLKELERLKLKPSLIVGTSMGSVVGGVYASGRSVKWIENYMMEDFNIRDMVATMQTLKWGEGPLVRIFQAGEAINHLRTKRGAESGEKILDKLREVTNDIDIKDTQIPFASNAVDMLSGREKVFKEGNLAEAIRCSMAIPPFFAPYDMEDGLFIDGGFADNMPINIAHQMGYKKVLSVDVSPLRAVSRSDLKNSFDVMFRAMSCSIKNAHRKNKATVAIEAYKGAYNMDFEHVKELIEVGEQAVRNHELKIKRKFSSWLS